MTTINESDTIFAPATNKECLRPVLDPTVLPDMCRYRNSWIWLDGSEMEFQIWASDQPRDSKFGAIYYNSSECPQCEYEWRSIKTDFRHFLNPFICKRSTLYRPNENGMYVDYN